MVEQRRPEEQGGCLGTRAAPKLALVCVCTLVVGPSSVLYLPTSHITHVFSRHSVHRPLYCTVICKPRAVIRNFDRNNNICIFI